jgi:hypothetical protein
MKKNYIIIITVFLISCYNKNDLNISDYVDYWEITKTYETFSNSSLLIDTLENNFKIVPGENQVLILEIERNPIFKKGKELTDLASAKSLLIELNIEDNEVSNLRPSNSKLFRKLIAFSPDYGINKLDSAEIIKFTRKDSTVWQIESQIVDFVFNAEFNFQKNQSLVTRYKDY